MKPGDFLTLPARATFLLLLFGLAYYLGYGTPKEDWRKDSPETGVVVRYTRNGRSWRICYDRDRNQKWDMWIDERAGQPYIVTIDDNGDGRPERKLDEWGNALSARQLSTLRSYKTLIEFLHNPRQLVYAVLAALIYGALEFLIRRQRKVAGRDDLEEA
jgi:hypothetical protein